MKPYMVCNRDMACKKEILPTIFLLVWAHSWREARSFGREALKTIFGIELIFPRCERIKENIEIEEIKKLSDWGTLNGDMAHVDLTIRKCSCGKWYKDTQGKNDLCANCVNCNPDEAT